MNKYLAMLCSQPDFLWPENTNVLVVRQIVRVQEQGFALMGRTPIHNELYTVFNVMQEVYPHEYEEMLERALAYACGRLGLGVDE